MNQNSDKPNTETAIPSYVAFSHLVWQMLGPTLWAVSIVHMNLRGTSLTSPNFIAAILCLICMTAARFVEQSSGFATNAYGDPSTWTEVRKYAIGSALLTACGIGIAMFLHS